MCCCLFEKVPKHITRFLSFPRSNAINKGLLVASQVVKFGWLSKSFLFNDLASPVLLPSVNGFVCCGQVAFLVRLSEGFLWMGLASQVAFLVRLSECFLWIGLASQAADFVTLSEGFLWMGLASQAADFVTLSEGFLWMGLASQVAYF